MFIFHRILCFWKYHVHSRSPHSTSAASATVRDNQISTQTANIMFHNVQGTGLRDMYSEGTWSSAVSRTIYIQIFEVIRESSDILMLKLGVTATKIPFVDLFVWIFMIYVSFFYHSHIWWVSMQLSCLKSINMPFLILPKLHQNKQVLGLMSVNTLRPRQNGRHLPDDISKRIFLNENARISIKISLKFVPKGPINYNPSLVQIMAWRWSGDKPLSEPMMVSLLTHICVTRPQWVNSKLGC